MSSDELRRLSQLEQENIWLKKILAERDLEIEVMKEINARKMVGAPARLQVSYARCRGLSSRRTCQLMRVARSTLAYCSVMPEKDAPVSLQWSAYLHSIRVTAIVASRYCSNDKATL